MSYFEMALHSKGPANETPGLLKNTLCALEQAPTRHDSRRNMQHAMRIRGSDKPSTASRRREWNHRP